MYIIIRRESDLGKLDALKNMDQIFARFMMNGCTWCEKTQPDWNRMTTTMSPQLKERDAIVEVESQFVDTFRKIMEKYRKPFPPVRAYPSMYIMSRGVASPHEGRDTNSLVKVLQQMQMVRDGPTPMSPKVRFMEKSPSPKQVDTKSRKSPLKKNKRKSKDKRTKKVKRV